MCNIQIQVNKSKCKDHQYIQLYETQRTDSMIKVFVYV